MKKSFKTTVLRLLSGKSVRISKADVIAIHEQMNIRGGYDTAVFMNTGHIYYVDEIKEIVSKRIFG